MMSDSALRALVRRELSQLQRGAAPAVTMSAGSSMSIADVLSAGDVRLFGSRGGVADDTAAVNLAIAYAATVPGLMVNLPYDLTVTALTNTAGVQFTGPGRILKAITGGTQRLSTSVDYQQHCFGAEYMAALHYGIVNNQDISLFCSGDSTTAGTAVSGNYIPDVLLGWIARLRGVKKLSTYNRGHSGEDSAQWLATHLANDLAEISAAIGAGGRVMYLWRWGINDPIPGHGRTAAQLTADLRAGLTILRAAHGVATLAIVIMSPNTVSNTPNSSDERWFEQLYAPLRQAARDFKCGYYGVFEKFRDSRGAANIWMDDPYGDGRAVHPLNQFNVSIFSGLADDLLFPSGLAPALHPASQSYGGIEDVRNSTSLPSAFDAGCTTVGRANKNTDTAWPFDGAYEVIRPRDGTFAIQRNWPYNLASTKWAVRTGTLSGWNAWQQFPEATTGSNINLPALLNGWSLYSTASRSVLLLGDGIIVTPDSAATSIVGDIDLRVSIIMTDWTPAANQMLASKLSSNFSCSYDFYVQAATGKLVLRWSPTGSNGALLTAVSSVATGVADGTMKWVRATLAVNNGGGGNDAKFWTSPDNVTWTQLGTTVTTAGVTSIFNGTDPLELGSSQNGASLHALGSLFAFKLHNGIGGALVASFDPQADGVTGAASVTASTGEVWTMTDLVIAGPQFRALLTPDGTVRFRGRIKSGTTTAATIIATLPAGFRPAERCVFACATNTNGDPATIAVEENGNVVIDYCPSNGMLALDSISYVRA